MKSVELFDEWTTYGKLVANDYMSHRALFAALSHRVAGRLDELRAIVDLGCGDCGPISDFLKEFEIERYVGIDLSEEALSRARETLARAGVSSTLVQGSLPEDLRRISGEFDLAVASYSLHHLETPHKQAALTLCRRLLRHGGLLAVIDVFCEDGEARLDYLERWEKHARRTYTALAPEEMEFLLTHVRACDFPESLASYGRLATAAGFDAIESVSVYAGGLERLVVLS